MKSAKYLLMTALFAACACNAPQSSAVDQVVETSSATYTLAPVAEGLEFPWGLAVLENGDMLVAERDYGHIRLIQNGELVPTPLEGVPEVYNSNQGGLFDILLDPDFATNRTLYVSFSSGDNTANATTLIKATLSEDATALENVETIFEANFKKRGGGHFGGRIGMLPDGTLLLTLGEGFAYMDESQNPENHLGSIVRINTDGSVPDDNPMLDTPKAAPETYSYGHRNVQGLAIDTATGTIYAHEHGPKGGDEVNIIKPGANYGWPVITYGVNYDGTIISNETEKAGMEQPIAVWVPSIAPSGMTLYTGDKHPEWKGDLLVSALSGMQIRRLDLENGRVEKQEIILEPSLRLRSVVTAPDGEIYVTTDELEGGVYKLIAE